MLRQLFQSCERVLDVFNITLMRQQAEIEVCFHLMNVNSLVAECHQVCAINKSVLGL